MGPAYDVFYDTGQHYIFSLVRDKSGNIFVGTGDEGKVFRVDPQGKGSLTSSRGTDISRWRLTMPAHALRRDFAGRESLQGDRAESGY